MRILLTTDPIGGVWMFTQELTTELLRRGHAVALVSFGRAPSPEHTRWAANIRECFGAAFRFEACTTPLEWMQGNESAYFAAEPLLLRVAREFRADIFHSNQFCFGRLPVRIPRIVTAHSDVLSWGRACRPEGLQPSPWLDRYRALVRRGLAGADTVTAPTAWMLKALQVDFRVDAETCAIPNGRSLGRDHSSVRKLHAVSVGRLWDEAKNFSLLAQLQDTMPVVVAGEERHENSRALPAGSVLQALGPLDERALLTLFRESSVYLAASVYEPFGFAPLEAALCGCAVLAHAIPSLVEVWGEGALFFRNAGELAALLRHLADSPDDLSKARARSLLRAQGFSAARMAESYESLYAASLEGAAAKRKLANLPARGSRRPEQELATYAV